jgi:hypothetical protein
MPEALIKMRAQDLFRVLVDYCQATDEEENAAWRAWNLAWEKADEGVRRDALMIAATRLVETQRVLFKSV